jgi:iron complex outermembrane recepter protein
LSRRAAARLALGLAAALNAGHACADNPAEVFKLPAVTVIGTTPLPGLGTASKDVAANVQVFGSGEFSRQRPRDLTEFLDRNANSIGVASGQGNLYQQDLNFRGFGASPLLGAPQGISVFQDGVRINEAFGDVVNWDLLPPSAISSVQLIPGSNPVFGLNTLGGALAIYTKSGAQYPGGSIELSAGAFGRRAAGLEYGGTRDRLDYFVTGNIAEDSGWADHNPSRVKQLFGKIGYQDDGTDLDLSVTLADNTLQGTQTLPQAWLDTPQQAYTFPDTNRNRLAFIAAKGSRFLTDAALLGGNVYYRRYRNTNVSSNVNGAHGELDPATGRAQANQATNDRSSIDQKSWGVGLQLTLQGEVGSRKHQLVVGASGDFGDTGFSQQSQPASFTPERNAIAAGDFAAVTDVGTGNRYVGVFVADTLTLDDKWTLTLAGRYNRARIDVGDRSGHDPGLDSANAFARFNPAIGLNFNPVPAFTGYAAYNEGMRAPSPVELTCANAAAPCKLPNIFLSDPPLKKVVSKTFEVGARGTLEPATSWSAAVYRTDLADDIQFIAGGQGAINSGFFQNVGKTRRQGIELAAGTRFGDLAASIRYSRIEATFRSPFIAASPHNSTADENGAIAVRPGNRIPGIPADTLKLRIDLDVDTRWSVGAGAIYASSQYAVGDENNRDRHGRVPAYTVVSLDTRFQASAALQLFVTVANLFDRRYQNFGLLGANAFTGPGRTFGPAVGIEPVAEQFRAIGAPRSFWAGLRYAFGAQKAGD